MWWNAVALTVAIDSYEFCLSVFDLFCFGYDFGLGLTHLYILGEHVVRVYYNRTKITYSFKFKCYFHRPTKKSIVPPANPFVACNIGYFTESA